MRSARLLVALAGAVLFGGCASANLARCHAGETRLVVDTLYFGTERPDGGARVSNDEWQQFLAEAVTARFPDGLTVVEANGQWRDKSGAIEREGSHVVQIAHPDAADRDAAIHAVVDAYKQRFHQEAVMRVRSQACVSF
jgi:hypothetical protein